MEKQLTSAEYERLAHAARVEEERLREVAKQARVTEIEEQFVQDRRAVQEKLTALLAREQIAVEWRTSHADAWRKQTFTHLCDDNISIVLEQETQGSTYDRRSTPHCYIQIRRSSPKYQTLNYMRKKDGVLDCEKAARKVMEWVTEVNEVTAQAQRVEAYRKERDALIATTFADTTLHSACEIGARVEDGTFSFGLHYGVSGLTADQVKRINAILHETTA